MSQPQPPSEIVELVEAERRRQWQKLVLIPSESICDPRAAQIESSVFSNIYAEGQPEPPLLHDPRNSAADPARFASWQTRLADGRYYRGCINANRAELLAHQFIAECFSKLEGSPAPDEIHVCVQALSGSPANTAVYEAVLEHGDTILSLDLAHGGHLTHGSEFNYSGKTFNVVAYGIDPETRRLDYDRIAELAREHKPRLVIGGASSYPWDFDWAALRAIADEVGAFVLADIAHLAGMVAAGLLNNPLPHVHAVTFTTHKTLFGPRGAVILTTYPTLAKKIKAGVFPGLQGGPHLHSIAAIARRFELIGQERAQFVELQQTVLDNTAYFAERLEAAGFTLEYGGTSTHMLLIDLKRFDDHPNPTIPIDGEIASRLLEIAGIVCNKNVLPGDETGGKASGIRLGMPWATQRGINRAQIAELASIIKTVLSNVHTTRVWVPAGEERCRGRVPEGILPAAAERVQKIVSALPYPPEPKTHATFCEPPVHLGRAAWLLRGDKVSLALGQMLTCSTLSLDVGEAAAGRMLRRDGAVIDDVAVVNLGQCGREERFALLTSQNKGQAAIEHVAALSDGYLLFDEEDLYAKVDGPTVIEPLPENLVDCLPDELPEPTSDVTKPYFIGQTAEYARAQPDPKPTYEYKEADRPVRRTLLNQAHKDLGAKMASFAGWEMPVQYPDGVFAEHAAVRTAAGLFDISHMSLFEISGRNAVGFLDTVLANCVSRMDPGQAQYTYMLYPDGTAIDDMYIYRLARDRFMLVANAANAERDWDWINAVNSREVAIDGELPARQIEVPVEIRNLREDGLVGLALQGPKSAAVLCRLAADAKDRFAIPRLEQNRFVRVWLAGIECLLAATGYTGEAVGFEVYVHPTRCAELWDALLEAGEPLGVRPAGLAARDSTRTEAGFPLFGHELEGPCRLSITEAGYGFIARFHVPFFIGRRTYIDRVRSANQRVIRVRGQGRRSVRPGHVVIDQDGAPIGRITSFAFSRPDFTFFALAVVPSTQAIEPGDSLRAVRQNVERYEAPPKENAVVDMDVLTRFPEDEERATWPELYA